MSQELPLLGVRILDLSLLLPGPLASQHLADLGAEVIKVENPRAYDASRAMTSGEKSLPGLFLTLNRNKKAITLNLKRKGAKDILWKLLETTDVLLEGFRPDAMDKMGFGYEELAKDFPKLIYCGISGYGSKGAYKDFAGHDLNYLALSGVLHQTGNPPRPAGFQLADVGGGSLTAVSSILAALYAREKTGMGRKIEISMTDASLQFLSLYTGLSLGEGKTPVPGGEILSGKLPNYNTYLTKEGRYVALGALEDMFFQVFLKAAGIATTTKDLPLVESNLAQWKKILSEFFLERTYQDLEPIFQNEDACLSPVLDLQEVLHSSHWKERGMVWSGNHPKYGTITQLGSTFGLVRAKDLDRLPAPDHGQHTVEILQGLGYSQEDIQALRQDRVI